MAAMSDSEMLKWAFSYMGRFKHYEEITGSWSLMKVPVAFSRGFVFLKKGKKKKKQQQPFLGLHSCQSPALTGS